MSAGGVDYASQLIDAAPREYLLGELHCAALRARLAACDIDTIGVALRAGWIDDDVAIEWLHDCAALVYVMPTPPQRGAL
jgi:hypothetical protein